MCCCIQGLHIRAAQTLCCVLQQWTRRAGHKGADPPALAMRSASDADQREAQACVREFFLFSPLESCAMLRP